MTNKPFGVNLTVLPTINPPPYEEYAQVILDEGIKIVETAGLVKEYVKKFKEAGAIILHKCTTIRHCLSAIKMGVDFLSVDGFECGGHIGEHVSHTNADGKPFLSETYASHLNHLF